MLVEDAGFATGRMALDPSAPVSVAIPGRSQQAGGMPPLRSGRKSLHRLCRPPCGGVKLRECRHVDLSHGPKVVVGQGG
jgi:hypothetical protein